MALAAASAAKPDPAPTEPSWSMLQSELTEVLVNLQDSVSLGMNYLDGDDRGRRLNHLVTHATLGESFEAARVQL